MSKLRDQSRSDATLRWKGFGAGKGRSFVYATSAVHDVTAYPLSCGMGHTHEGCWEMTIRQVTSPCPA